MARALLEQSIGREPGTWRLWSMGKRVGVIIACPRCGRESTLVHEVRLNGDVEPSAVCPHQGCDWHEFIQLLDWPGMHLHRLT